MKNPFFLKRLNLSLFIIYLLVQLRVRSLIPATNLIRAFYAHRFSSKLPMDEPKGFCFPQ